MPYVYYLPSYAATAWYHKVLKDRPADLNAFLTDARRFASTHYASALLKGSRLSQSEKTAIAEKVSRFTGLSTDYILKADLRVKLPQFMEELQRSRGLTTGRLDALPARLMTCWPSMLNTIRRVLPSAVPLPRSSITT